ncbi:MAG TPA: hypothetical protein VK157_00990 [Phycisphaerales bacterium]|nr:hypothetical protein [Phycisphaerales bacterium]
MKTSAKVAIGVTLALFAAAGVIAYRVHSIMHATVSPTHDYPAQVTAITSNATKRWTPQGDYQRVINLTQAFTDAEKRLLPPDAPRRPPQFSLDVLRNPGADPESDPRELDIARMMLEDHASSGRLASMQELPRLVGASRPLAANQPLFGMPQMELGSFRAATRAASLTAERRLAQGDISTLVPTVEQLLALAVIAGSQPTAIDSLMGIAINARAHELIRTACASRDLDEDTAKQLLQLIDAYPLPRVRDVHLETERLILRDIIQWTYTDDGSGNGRFAPAAVAKFASTPAAVSLPMSPSIVSVIMFDDRKSAERLCDEYFDAAKAQAAQPARLRDFSSLRALPNTWGRQQLILSIFAPSLATMISSDTGAQFTRDGTRLLLAIEAYRAKNNRYPASLDDLVPAILPELPIDEWAPDGRFVYRVLAAPQADGREFLLYSIGADKKDDNAKHIDSALTTDKVPGDYVFNLPPDAMHKPE